MSETWAKYVRSKSRPRRARDRTLEVYQSHWSEFLRWLQDKHPKVTLAENVTITIAEGFMDHIEETYSPTTYNRKLHTLKLIFKTVCPLHQPFSEFQKNPETHQERVPFTDAELRTIRAKATGDMADLIDLGILTGQRMEDLCRLRKDTFDTPNQHNSYTSGYLTLRQGKTRKWVNVPAFQLPPLWELLTRLRDGNATEYFLPALAEHFTRDYHDSYVSKRFGKLLDDCEISHLEERQNGKHRISRKSFHSLRHGFVTIARLCGIPDAVIQSITGHSNRMLEGYAHMQPAQINAFLKAAGVNGELKDKVKTLPENAGQVSMHMVDAEPIKNLIEKLNTRNVKATKAELLALLS